MLVFATRLAVWAGLLAQTSNANLPSESLQDSCAPFDGLSLVAFEGREDSAILAALSYERPAFMDECHETPLALELHSYPCTVAALTERQLAVLASLYPYRVFTSDFGAQLRRGSSLTPQTITNGSATDRSLRRQGNIESVRCLRSLRRRVTVCMRVSCSGTRHTSSWTCSWRMFAKP